MSVDDKTIPILGTDVGRALDEAYHAMEKNDRKKLLVLMTDGEDLEKGGIDRAKALAKEGVTIFTVGVGTAAGDEIQILNEQGRAELVRDSKGEVVRSHLDETTLRAIAEATHGADHPLGAVGEGVAKVQRAIALLALGTMAGSGPARKYGVDRFYVPIALVLMLLVAESLRGTRRPGWSANFWMSRLGESAILTAEQDLIEIV